ncbi:MAG: hypothetical protein JRJ84_12295 [Deltaproteobacteria bacterium]|nr:hypothetical protein [Deltaproteobacteria bacterium]
MWRWLLLVGCLSGVTGCYDFTGDLGRIGFVSNLSVRADQKWDPTHPIASGTRAEFVAVEIIGKDSEEEPDVTGRVRGRSLEVEEDGPEVAVTGAGHARGKVSFRGDATDRFSFGFSPASRVTLVDPVLAAMEEEDVDTGAIAVVRGATLTLWPEVTDARGRVLGWDPDDLEPSAMGPISAWREGAEVHITADGRAGARGLVDFQLLGASFSELEVLVADMDAIQELEILTEVTEFDEGTLVIASVVGRLEDGTRLHGIAPDWSWTGGEEVDDAPKRGDVIVLGFEHGAVFTEVEADLNGLIVHERVPLSN